MKRKIFASIIVIAGFGLQASASLGADDRDQSLRDAFVSAYGESFRVDQLASYVNRIFQDVDVNRDGIERAEIDRLVLKLKAEARARIVSDYLRYDLNGDFEITTEEIVSVLVPDRGGGNPTSNEVKRRRDKAVERVLRDDANGDGRISLDELKAIEVEPGRRDGLRRLRQATLAEELLKTDADGDGKITQIEAFAAIGKAFAGIDPSIYKKMGRDKASSAGIDCRAPQVPAGNEVVLFGTYEGEAISSVSVAGQDRATTAGTIAIESGTRPLTVFVTSYEPMMWRFEGDTQRVAQVVATAIADNPDDRKAAAGVVGIRKDRVSFLPARQCLHYFHDTKLTDAATAQKQLLGMIMRPPDKVFGVYGLNKVRLPSGAIEEPPRRKANPSAAVIEYPDRTIEIGHTGKATVRTYKSESERAEKRLADSLSRFYPNGVMTIDPRLVVSDTKAEAYQVLPLQAGMLQLLKDGVLASKERGSFEILKKMRYPAELTGLNNMRFVLKKGVPMPDGDPGDSCVYSEDMNQFIAQGIGCRFSE